MSKYSSIICRAIIANKIPDESYNWSVVQVLYTTVIRGGGESTSWHPYVLVRLDGKQIYRDTVGMFECDNPLKQFGDRLIEVDKGSRLGTIYVLKPENCENKI